MMKKILITGILLAGICTSAVAQEKVVVIPLNSNRAAGTDRQVQYNDSGKNAGAEVYYDKTTGNVGIGDPIPTEVLEVNGNVKANSFIGDGSGLTGVVLGTESDPTVPASIKDGIGWTEVTGRPSGLDDGDDNTQLSEAEVDTYVSNNGYLTAEVDGSTTNEIELPSQTGNDGKVLSTNGASPSWITVTDTDTTYTGANFATSSQNCPAGFLVTGISGSGTIVCTSFLTVSSQATVSTMSQLDTTDMVKAGPSFWQSFTAITDLSLTAVKMYSVQGYWSGMLNIYSGNGTGGTLIHSQPYTNPSIPGGGWQNFILTEAVPLTGGQVYTVYLDTSISGFNGAYMGRFADVLAGGQADNSTAYDYAIDFDYITN